MSQSNNYAEMCKISAMNMFEGKARGALKACTSRPQRCAGFGSRPLQVSEYLSKASHMEVFWFPSAYKSYICTVL